MASVQIRKSGGSQIISLPAGVTQALGLNIGDSLKISMRGKKVILEPEEVTLESLLAGSPSEGFEVTEEDREWLDAPASKGGEF